MRTAQGVNVHVNVFLCERSKERTIFQRGFHRKLKDQARRPVPNAFACFVLDSAFTDGVSRFEEIAPASFARSDEAAASFDERRSARLRDRRAPTACHTAIVAGP